MTKIPLWRNVKKMSTSSEYEFEVLGCRVKFNPVVDGGLSPTKVIELVNKEAQVIRASAPNRSDAEIAVLVALKLASEKIAIETEYKDNLNKLENSVSDALELVEQVSRATV